MSQTDDLTNELERHGIDAAQTEWIEARGVTPEAYTLPAIYGDMVSIERMCTELREHLQEHIRAARANGDDALTLTLTAADDRLGQTWSNAVVACAILAPAARHG